MVETIDFVPLPPDVPANPNPADGNGNLPLRPTLSWYGGPWAHLYDLYIDTDPGFTHPAVFSLAEPSSKTETSRFSYTLPVTLAPYTTYYWRVVGKTMALRTRTSPIWAFTTRSGG